MTGECPEVYARGSMGASPSAGLHIQRVRQHEPYKEVATAGMQGKQKKKRSRYGGDVRMPAWSG